VSIIKSIQSSKLFFGSVLEVKPAPIPDRILVSNLKPKIGDTLQLYFEQAKYNPADLEDPVEIDLDVPSSSALVRFKQPSSKFKLLIIYKL